MARGIRNSDSKRYVDWLYLAGLDRIAAETLVEDMRCYKAAAFHCQQCIEKALKGFLLFKRNRLYDGHNISWLCKQAMEIDPHFKQWLSAGTRLNKVYIESRYPADIPWDISASEMDYMMNTMHEILGFIEKLIHFDFISYRKRD